MKFYNKPVTKCIILHNVLYFQETVICLHSLFEERNPPSEISFSCYFSNIGKDAIENKINDIRNEYLTAHLNKFRNQLIAHKQADTAGDPIAGFLTPIKKEHVERASSIVNKLRSLINISFNCPANNYFDNYYNLVLKFFIKPVKQHFKKTKSSP